jgi:hypothetical protein
MFPSEADTIMLQMGVFSLVCWSIAFPIIGVWVKRKLLGEIPPRIDRYPCGRVRSARRRVLENARG